MSIRIGNTILPINNVGIQSYQQSFDTGDFQENSSTHLYELIISYDQHKIDNIGFVVSYQLVENNYCTCLCDYQFDSNNNVKILSSNPYNGMVSIFGI